MTVVGVLTSKAVIISAMWPSTSARQASDDNDADVEVVLSRDGLEDGHFETKLTDWSDVHSQHTQMRLLRSDVCDLLLGSFRNPIFSFTCEEASD